MRQRGVAKVREPLCISLARICPPFMNDGSKSVRFTLVLGVAVQFVVAVTAGLCFIRWLGA